MKKNNIEKQIYEVTIEKNVFGGYGIGYVEEQTLFVNKGIRGDRLLVTVDYTKKELLFCSIKKILSPSKHRTFTLCKQNDLCGSCDWVNMNYDDQIELKTDIYHEIFGSKVSSLEIQKSPIVYHYRNKAFLPVQAKDGKKMIGSYMRNSHNVIEHESCYLFPQVFKKIFDVIKDWMDRYDISVYDEKSHSGVLRHVGIRASSDMKSFVIILVSTTKEVLAKIELINEICSKFPMVKGIVINIQNKANNLILGEKDKVIFGVPHFTDFINDIKLKIHYKAFYQVNIPQAINIYKDIYEKTDKDDIVIDAFSGIGVIGFYLANKVRKVICIEENKEAVESAIDIAEKNSLRNMSFIQNRLEMVIDKTIKKEKNVSVIIFNPPRKGLSESTINSVSLHSIKKIIYMSCDPMTLKRDIQLFEEKGYELVFLKGYDMFPHTWHIESLAVLKKSLDKKIYMEKMV